MPYTESTLCRLGWLSHHKTSHMIVTQRTCHNA